MGFCSLDFCFYFKFFDYKILSSFKIFSSFILDFFDFKIFNFFGSELGEISPPPCFVFPVLTAKTGILIFNFFNFTLLNFFSFRFVGAGISLGIFNTISCSPG